MTQNARSSWQITLTAVGKPSKIIKDGEDISRQVARIAIHSGANETTRVAVTYILADVNVEIEEAEETPE